MAEQLQLQRKWKTAEKADSIPTLDTSDGMWHFFIRKCKLTREIGTIFVFYLHDL